MHKLSAIIYVALLATVDIVAILFNPLIVFMVTLIIVTFLAISREINLYQIATIIKCCAKKHR
jgi:hypothetical protein